jgi:hypothetical protein
MISIRCTIKVSAELAKSISGRQITDEPTTQTIIIWERSKVAAIKDWNVSYDRLSDDYVLRVRKGMMDH